jgi:hypothetical protein
MFEKDWTPEQVGRLTLGDLRILVHEKPPPEPASGERPAISRDMAPAERAQAIRDYKARLLAKRDSWED